MIAALTLRPDPGSAELGLTLEPVCLICGDRGLADALLNMALFAPLGLALGRCMPIGAALLVGGLASAGIELAQTGLPGRFPTVGDLVFNVTGTGLGVLAWPVVPRLRALPRAVRVALAAAVAVLALAPAVLLAPSYTGGDYFAQWAPTLPNPRAYEGAVLEAWVGERPTRIGRLRRSDSLRADLGHGAPIGIRFVVAPATAGLSPVYRIADERNREIAMIGVGGTDLVVTGRTRASAMALQTAPAVWPRALAGAAPGDTVAIIARKENGSLCVDLDSRTRCDLAPSLGMAGWQLLLVPDPPRPRWAPALALAWLAIPAALVGLATGPGSPGKGAWVAAAAAAALVAAAGGLSPWVGTHAAEIAAAGAGVLLGAAAARLRLPRGWRR